MLRDVLKDKGHGNVSESILRKALDQLFAVTQTNWILEDDALPTLQRLETDGYRMGLLSNAGDDQDVQQSARRFGGLKNISISLSHQRRAVTVNLHRRIFELALQTGISSLRKPYGG